MKLLVAMLLVAVAIGYLAGGRVSNLANLHLRWAPLALIALVLQVIDPPGSWPLVLLIASFVLLSIFVVANRRIAGFWLVLVGVALNFAVIGVNGGMPVSTQALVASGQTGTVGQLTGHAERSVKHHLATDRDIALFLGDVIAIPPPMGQAVSLGDIFTYGGVAIVVVMGMRRRSDVVPVVVEELQRAGG
jgi:uncharacterized protein DUF5317